MNPRAVWLIAKSVLIEGVRRREIYAIVLVSLGLIGAVMAMDFFALEGLTKFYREVALKVMGVATALTVIVLASRQLPREFETRTIYPLLAKPVTRVSFLAGKLLGVFLAAGFCFGLFMAVFVIGTLYTGTPVPVALLAQHIYLQMILMLILATFGFWLSMVLNLDAAITIGVLFYTTASLLTSMTSMLYDYMTGAGQLLISALVFAIPQLTLFDLSEKTIHAEAWGPLSGQTLGILTLYGGVFIAVYFALAAFSFQRRAL